jgi:lipopolysaccharide/colanic/teichoic acid biosynthesis glycosyltransferase
LTKRALDIGIAAAVLALISWLIVLAGVAVVATSPGPAFYPQIRVGRNGQRFRCWKLRTMVSGAEAMLDSDPQLRAMYGENFKMRSDPRITTTGRLLRASSLDELPQLWNVLRGEMSIVGPRPVLVRELTEKYGGDGAAVVSVRPGLTGLWQVSGRSAVSYARRVELDLEYVANRSTALDLWIIVRTPMAVLRGERLA